MGSSILAPSQRQVGTIRTTLRMGPFVPIRDGADRMERDQQLHCKRVA